VRSIVGRAFLPAKLPDKNVWPTIRNLARPEGLEPGRLVPTTLLLQVSVASKLRVGHILISMGFRFKSSSELKYYLYVSKAKVDMLYDQVGSSGKQNKSLEWGFDLKAIKLKRKSATQEEPDSDDKLKAVIREIESLDLVGTVDEPKDYVKGTLPMRWGLYRGAGRPDEEPPLVYFGGRTSNTLFGLGGSSKHVIGNFGASSTGSRSVTPHLVAHLLQGLGVPQDGWNTIRNLGDEFDYDTCSAIALATDHLKGPEQILEFYAKTLWTGRFTDPYSGTKGMTDVVLGSPIFVSLASPYPQDLSNY
jgi:uncharacterized protein DUF7019